MQWLVEKVPVFWVFVFILVSLHRYYYKQILLFYLLLFMFFRPMTILETKRIKASPPAPPGRGKAKRRGSRVRISADNILCDCMSIYFIVLNISKKSWSTSSRFMPNLFYRKCRPWPFVFLPPVAGVSFPVAVPFLPCISYHLQQ
jgi:hypothetical protein